METCDFGAFIQFTSLICSGLALYIEVEDFDSS